MSKSCWDCLHFIVDSAYDESGRCGEHASFDGMTDEACTSFEPLPKGACCARCSHCDWQHGRCVKHDRPVYTPDAMPCRNYDPNREEEPQEDGTLLLPGLDKVDSFGHGQTVVDYSRPFQRGDVVNVLSIERGKLFKENVLVMDETLSDHNGRTYVTVTLEPGMSIEEANKRCLFSEFDYTRIVLVRAVDEEGGSHA